MGSCWSSPPEEVERKLTLLGNQSHQLTSLNNGISTTKYNLATFMPLFLFEQFRKYWNIYFLLIGCLQQIPGISPTGRWGTIGPLVIILLVTALKEVWEDFHRLQQDRKINSRKVQVWRGDRWAAVAWEEVSVGELVMVRNREPFPADLVLLASSGEEGIAYIETSNLDGETNLKVRQSLQSTSYMLGNIEPTSAQMSQLQDAVLECEAPNKKLYDFAGSLKLAAADTAPLSNDQVLLRGSRLVNTDRVTGVVVYTGHQSKLMMNSIKAPLKESTIQQVINVQIIYLFFLLIFISILSAAFNHLGRETRAYVGSLETEDWSAKNSFMDLLTFCILYNNVIPISLQITLEMVKVFQAMFINMDKEMFYKKDDNDEGTWALARTSNLNEELGQIKYVFSDKTGTLTQNIMEFKFLGINGVKYSEDKLKLKAAAKQEPLIEMFLTILSVCHSVIPEVADDGSLEYNASSPDEKAFVDAARDFGFRFKSRTPIGLTIEDWSGKAVTYELLAEVQFTSARKRMSVLVRTVEGRILLLTKGADSVIMSRLAASQQAAVGPAQAMLDDFAKVGLRTMALGMREVAESEYKDFKVDFDKAGILLEGREEALDKAAVGLERDLELVAVTAIEDKLQDRVPETVANLLQAGIHVWVLTGDKQETAIDIGRSCRMITPEMEPLIVVNADTAEAASSVMAGQLGQMEAQGTLGKDNEKAVIIDGRTLGLVLEDAASSQQFARLGTSCKSVICCRVSPSQKADVVKLVQRFTHGTVSLAIGDGANDVAMIQAARVGVGISGNEGLQAANSADFSIAQFRFLQRLLFLHGAWNYGRIAKVLLYSFNKNITLYIIQMWFAVYNRWTGKSLFDSFTITLFNVVFTAMPPFALGLFDRSGREADRMDRPGMYSFSQRGLGYSDSVFWRWILQAVIQSAILFWLPMLAMETGVNSSSGHAEGFLELGTTVYTCVVVTVIAKALVEKDAVTTLCLVLLGGSVFSWFVFLSVYSYLPLFTAFTNPGMLDSFRILATNTGFWFCLLTAPPLCVALDVLAKSLLTAQAQGPDQGELAKM